MAATYTAWKDFYGSYMRSGAPYNVALGGSPNGTGPYDVDLTTAHNNGYGYGIRFTNSGYKVTAQLNLIGYAIRDNSKWVSTSPSYAQYGGTYDYALTIQISKDGGDNYTDTVFNQWIFSHGDTWGMAYNGSWLTTARKSQWTGNFTVPVGTTHVKFTLTAENPRDVDPVVFPITDIITDFRPWAIRKSGTWVSLDNEGYHFKIRQGGKWIDTPKYQNANAENEGSSRIRHSGKWYSQSKVGE